MLISLDWLSQYVDIDGKKDELEEALTMIGQEVEEITEEGEGLSNVVIGKIVSFENHPDSEKLTLLKVDVESEELQIVCGAPNHKLGDKVVVAKVGAVLPGDFKIKKAKVRGVESLGMVCSEVELGLGKDSDGVIILPEDAPIGMEVKEYYDLNDTIYELEITPNRPDCLSHIGIARELAAFYNTKVKYPKESVEEVIEGSGEHIKLEILDKTRCKRYTTRVVKDVTVGESPKWLKKRIKAMGLNPVNNVVDITNFVMFEYNHPIHAFDLKKIEGNVLKVREAAGEKVVTLDGSEVTLDNKELVIADENKVVAIAGIMGCENSQVDEKTTDIVIEVAYFTPENIRKTSKNLGISSDSSYRFERGIDREDAVEVVNRAATLIREVAKGTVLSGIIEKYNERSQKVEVSLNYEKLNTFTGKEIPVERVGEILTNLGMETVAATHENITVTPPSFREDITRTADLYEEVLRMYGFKNIEAVMPVSDISEGSISEETLLVDKAKKNMVEIGLQEVINYSFIPGSAIKKIRYNGSGELIELMNPISEEMSTMRPTLSYGLLSNVRDNFNRNQDNLKLFEVSRVYTKGEELANEGVRAGIILAGKREKELWNPKEISYDFYDLKGYVERFLTLMGIKRYQVSRSTNELLHPGRSVEIRVGKDVLGTYGEVHPSVLKDMDIKKDKAYIAELDLDKFSKYASTKIKYEALVKYPEVTRDLAIVLDKEALVGEMLDTVKKTAKFVEDVKLFDIYSGDNLEAGKKSVAIRVVMRKKTGTLSEEEIKEEVEKVLDTISKKYGGEIRK